MLEQLRAKRAHEDGFTLIELLIAIVVVGVLAAVVIVGVSSVQNKGQSSACTATKDAVQTAQIVHYANTHGSYPADFQVMQTAGELSLSGTAAITSLAPGTNNQITGDGWTLAINGGGGAAPLTFTACP